MKGRAFLAAFLALGIGLVSCELLLQLLGALSPEIRNVLARRPVQIGPPRWIAGDPVLGERPNPENPDHDAWGYRNEAVPDAVPIVAMGDSQTYGMGVKREEAWPQRLAEISGEPVYNLSAAGWGLTELWMTFGQAKELRPRVVVAAFYMGNDLYDAYQAVYRRGQLPELASTDPGVVQEIRRLEETAPLRNAILKHFTLRRAGSAAALRRFLSDDSALYGLLRAARRAWENRGAETRWATQRRIALEHPESREVFEGGEVRTILTPPYRSIGLNLADLRIVEGLRISLEVLSRMAQEARANGFRFLVLVIPTKESAYAGVIEEAARSRAYRVLLDQERAVSSQVRTFLEQHSIEFIDLTPRFRTLLSQGIPLYRESSDGHPSAIGHRAIATIVHARLAGSEAAR